MSAKRKLLQKVTRGTKAGSRKVRAVSRIAPKVKLRTAAAKPAPRPKKFSKEEMILEYRANARKLSRSILRRWRSRIDLEELDSLVDLALCEAAERYDASKGASFMTFLFYHLRGCLVRAVDTAANANTISAADYEIEGLMSGMIAPVDSQESGLVAGADMFHELTNEEYLSPDELLYKREVAEISNQACAKLDELEQEVIYRLFVQEEQLVDIARSLGYSRCHISRVKKRALDVLHAQLGPQLEKKGRPLDDDEDEISLKRSLRKVISRRKFGKEEELAGRYESLAQEPEVVAVH